MSSTNRHRWALELPGVHANRPRGTVSACKEAGQVKRRVGGPQRGWAPVRPRAACVRLRRRSGRVTVRAPVSRLAPAATSVGQVESAQEEVPARLGGYGDTVIREHRQDERVDLTIVRSPARHARWRQQRVEPRSGRHLRRERLSASPATIAHLTITGGYGVGIRVARTVLTLNDSTVTSNIGGGISNSNQSLILNNSTVSENMASSCAGIPGDDDSIVEVAAMSARPSGLPLGRSRIRRGAPDRSRRADRVRAWALSDPRVRSSHRAALRARSFLPAGSAFHSLLAGDEDHADELRREQPVLDDTGGCAEPARKGPRV